jgi:hypothetical protein
MAMESSLKGPDGRWATGRSEKGVVRNIFEIKLFTFCGSCTGEELVKKSGMYVLHGLDG